MVVTPATRLPGSAVDRRAPRGRAAEGSPDVPNRSLTTAQVLTLLAEAPPRLEALTAGLAPARLRTNPAHGEWSANDVLAHLRSCADVWGGCIAAILAEERPTLRAVDPRTWIERTDYCELEFRPSLRAFAARRAALLAVLEPLPPEGWARAATVTGAGRPLERTVLSYARRLAVHERPHLKQVARIIDTIGARRSG
jgi:hypothetical protein